MLFFNSIIIDFHDQFNNAIPNSSANKKDHQLPVARIASVVLCQNTNYQIIDICSGQGNNGTSTRKCTSTDLSLQILSIFFC